jgi:hypothetical protein
MMEETVLINLVSKQPIPNILPILEPELQIKRVLLVSSQNMTLQLKRLQAVYADLGVPSEIFSANAPAYNVQAMQNLCRNILQSITESERICLNVTGGTKLMACSAWREIERISNASIIYVDTAQRQIHRLHPPGLQPLSMQSQMNLEKYMTAFGLTITDCKQRWGQGQKVPKLLSSTKNLAKYARKLHPFLGRVNWAGNTALNQDRNEWPRTVVMNSPFPAKGLVKQMVHELEQAGIFQIRGSQITFPGPEQAFYISGGWLEEYAFTQACRTGADEVGFSVQVQWSSDTDSQVHNEFDCLIVKHNQLWIVECKTIAFKEKAAEVVYKLDSLRENAAGVFGRSCLVLARKPPEHFVQRAATNGQVVIGPDHLPDLAKRLDHIIG